MANTNVQAILVCDTQMRPLADKLAQLYNLCKSLAVDAAANGWVAMFPADGQAIGDTSATDGRNPITNTDISQLITLVSAYTTFMEASANANRNLVHKIAVNPLRF